MYSSVNNLFCLACDNFVGNVANLYFSLARGGAFDVKQALYDISDCS